MNHLELHGLKQDQRIVHHTFQSFFPTKPTFQLDKVSLTKQLKLCSKQREISKDSRLAKMQDNLIHLFLFTFERLSHCQPSPFQVLTEPKSNPTRHATTQIKNPTPLLQQIRIGSFRLKTFCP